MAVKDTSPEDVIVVSPVSRNANCRHASLSYFHNVLPEWHIDKGGHSDSLGTWDFLGIIVLGNRIGSMPGVGRGEGIIH